MSTVVLSNLCYHCVYHQPFKGDHSLEKSTCSKFAGKYADLCRLDENKCGKEGKYFKENKDTHLDLNIDNIQGWTA